MYIIIRYSLKLKLTRLLTNQPIMNQISLNSADRTWQIYFSVGVLSEVRTEFLSIVLTSLHQNYPLL
jgi:hypothetical protein